MTCTELVVILHPKPGLESREPRDAGTHQGKDGWSSAVLALVSVPSSSAPGSLAVTLNMAQVWL